MLGFLTILFRMQDGESFGELDDLDEGDDEHVEEGDVDPLKSASTKLGKRKAPPPSDKRRAGKEPKKPRRGALLFGLPIRLHVSILSAGKPFFNLFISLKQLDRRNWRSSTNRRRSLYRPSSWRRGDPFFSSHSFPSVIFPLRFIFYGPRQCSGLFRVTYDFTCIGVFR